MPKQTFFNLPNDKREGLMNAVMKEFSRVPLFEASISNIIKDAGIPRGSFYQYFENKEDVYYFLLNEFAKRNSEKFKAIVNDKNGDLFDSFIEFFHYMLTNFQNLEYRNFFRNAFLNMNYKVENTLTHNVNEKNFKYRLSDTIGLINTEKLNISNEREVFHVFKIVMAVTFQNLIQSFGKNLSLEDALKNYTVDLSLLRKGIYKGEFN